MDYQVYPCNDNLSDTALDLLCQMKQHTIVHFGQRNLQNNLLGHNNGALRQSISQAVDAAKAEWNTTPNNVPWTGDDALLEQAWLTVGPPWLRKMLAIPHSEISGDPSGCLRRDAQTP